MKIFIAYESPAGGTRKMAELLGSLLPAESAALFDLRKEMPNPADFDFAVVGGPVYMGRLTGRLRRFLARSGGQTGICLKTVLPGFSRRKWWRAPSLRAISAGN